MKINLSTLLSYIFVMCLLINLIAPPLILGNNFKLRIDDVLILFSLPFLFILRPVIYFDRQFFLFLGLLTSMIASVLYGYTFLDVPPSLRDLNEIVRLSKPIWLLLLINVVDIDKLNKLVYKGLIFGSYFVAVMTFIQLVYPVLGVKLADIYGAEGHSFRLLAESPRITITGTDPNVAAAIVAYFMMFNLFRFIETRKIVSLVLFLILVVAILYTSSRTALFGVSLAILFLILFEKRIKKAIRFAVLFVAVLIGFLVIPQQTYIVEGTETFVEGQNRSLNMRFEKWDTAMDLFWESPVFGWGPAKEKQETVVDGEYVLVLRRFGVVGLLLLLVFIFYYPIKYYFSRQYKLFAVRERVLAQMTIFYMFVAASIMITNSFFSGYQLFVTYVILLGLTRLNHNKNKETAADLVKA